MKILICTGIYPPDVGGPAKYAKNLKEEFLRMGHSVKVLSYGIEKKLPIGLRHVLYFFRIIFALSKVDLIIGLDIFSTGFSAVLVGKIFGKKMILRVGGDFLWETYVESTGNLIKIKDFYANRPRLSLKFKIIAYFQKFALKNASALAFNSHWQKEFFEKVYNIKPKNNFVVENFYHGKEANLESETKLNEPIFLFAGRKIKFKNLKLLEEVFEELISEGVKAKLKIVDNLSPTELREKIKNSYALITVSVSDFAPNFIIEGLAENKPFILTKECGLMERLGELGIFIDPADKNNIKEAILSLMNESNYNKRKEKISAFNFSHSWSEIADEFLAIKKFMLILNLSLDKSILNKNSKMAKRIIEYGELVDGYAIVVPDKDYKEIRLSEKVFVYGSGGGNKIFRLLNIYRVAKKLLKQGKFDVITVQDQYYLALLGWILAKKFKIGLELQIHGFEKYSGLRKIIAKFVIPKANAIRCVSQRLKRQLINDFGVDEKKITIVPIFANTGNIKQTIKTRKNNFVFLTVGRLVSVKNIGLQIKAMAKISQKSKVKSQKVELWIVGDGPERKKLEMEAAKLGVKNNVKFLGWQNNPEEFYQQADAFLLTSDYEGWGMAVVEAAGYGLPIIMTDVGCAGELIENEKSGLIIPVNDQSKLEEAMIRFINDDNLRNKLAEGAFSAVKNLPSKEETLALYKKSWEKAMNNK